MRKSTDRRVYSAGALVYVVIGGVRNKTRRTWRGRSRRGRMIRHGSTAVARCIADHATEAHAAAQPDIATDPSVTHPAREPRFVGRPRYPGKRERTHAVRALAHPTAASTSGSSLRQATNRIVQLKDGSEAVSCGATTIGHVHLPN